MPERYIYYMLKDVLCNGWFFSFVAGWTLFLLLVDWQQLKKNIWGGIFATLLELWQDPTAIAIGMYHFKKPLIPIFGTSLFLTIGVGFTMGILVMQYLPANKMLQLAHIIVLSAGFAFFDYIIAQSGFLIELHWSYTGTFFLTIITFGTLAWLKQLIYKPVKQVR